jgi:glycine/D-amino acid oxidase-like deaminating enzyme
MARLAATAARSRGVEAELLSPEEARAIAPGIELEGLVGATYGPRDGLADPSGLTEGYATLARRAGAEIELGVEVSSIRLEDGGVAGVETSAGAIGAPVVVNAAGPWAAELARRAASSSRSAHPRHAPVTGPSRRSRPPHVMIDARRATSSRRASVLMGMGARANDRRST